MLTKRKSLLVDAHIFDKEPQGTTTYVKGVYKAFSGLYYKDFDIYITAANIDGLQQFFPALERRNFLPLPPSGSFSRLTQTLPSLIAKHNIDYAHFQQIAPLKKNCTHIVTVHDLLFNDFTDKFSLFYRLSRNFLFKRSLKQAEIRLTVSNYSKEAISKHYGIDNVHITPNAVQQKFFEPYDKQESIKVIQEQFGVKNYILFVSRIEERKNHLLLLKAYKDLKLYEKGIQLVFVGRNDIPVKKLEDELTNLTPAERESFHWLQDVDDQVLMHLYKASWLFVYPSIAEGFGMPPIEAGALQVNVLCSNTTAMQDFSFFQENLFNPHNPGEFKQKLLSNLNDPPSQATLLHRRNEIQRLYNWQSSATLLHHLISGHSSTSPR